MYEDPALKKCSLGDKGTELYNRVNEFKFFSQITQIIRDAIWLKFIATNAQIILD